MSSKVHALAEKMFRKYQQISTNLSNCDGVYFQKRIISKTDECVLKKNYIATLISWKRWKIPVHSLIRKDFSFSAFPFIDQERFFLFLWLFLMNGAVVQHSYIMSESGASDLFKKLLNMSGKYINNGFRYSDQKHLFLTNFWSRAENISCWYFQIRKNQLRG